MNVTSSDQGPKSASSRRTASPLSLFPLGEFIVITVLGLAGILIVCWIEYLGQLYWPAFFACGVVIGVGFGYSWWLAFRCREFVRALYLGGSLSEIDSITDALENSFGTLRKVLQYCFVAMLVSLACIGYLLKHR